MKKVPSNNLKELEKQKLSLMQFERTFKPESDFDKLKETLKEIQKIIKRIGTNNEIEIIESAKELVNFVNFELGKKVPENKEKNEIENENAKTSENKEKPEKESLSDNDEEHTYKDKEHKFRELLRNYQKEVSYAINISRRTEESFSYRHPKILILLSIIVSAVAFYYFYSDYFM